MVHLLVSENRNTDPVRFFQNRIRVFIGDDYAYGFWVDEDRLFSLLGDEQKRFYLTEKRGKPLEFVLEVEIVRKIVETGFVVHRKKELLNILSKLDQ